MLCAAAVVPQPPLLVPELAGGSAAALDDLRTACDAAVAGLLGSGPDRVVVVGAGSRTRQHPAGSRGSLAPYGVAMDVGLGGEATGGPVVLPLALTVGAWLLARADATVAVSGLELSPATPPGACAALGREVVGDGRVGLLVCGDGSARRSVTSPRGPDERAVPFDDAVRAALGTGDVAALLGLDTSPAEDLVVAGRGAWQVLAGAAEGARLNARLLASAAPYGVGYHVALWRARR